MYKLNLFASNYVLSQLQLSQSFRKLLCKNQCTLFPKSAINKFVSPKLRNDNVKPFILPRSTLYNQSSCVLGHHFHLCSHLGQEDGEEADKKGKSTKIVKTVSLETSMQYLESEAYKITYGDEPVWVKYRRNFKGQFAPKKTRVSCIKDGIMSTGNPCPICRDEYLVVDFRNEKLLKQFVCPYTDKILFWDKTCLCQQQQRNIQVAIEKARMHGILTFYVPFRKYDYNDYYNFKNKEN